jgi:hypothetical protein
VFQFSEGLVEGQTSGTPNQEPGDHNGNSGTLIAVLVSNSAIEEPRHFRHLFRDRSNRRCRAELETLPRG